MAIGNSMSGANVYFNQVLLNSLKQFKNKNNLSNNQTALNLIFKKAGLR